MKVSIIVPVYNEKDTVMELLKRLSLVPLDKEIIIVDDGSTDGTREILTKRWAEGVLHLCSQNGGKGAAIRTGLTYAAGDAVIIQDADLEYDPQDIPRLLEKIERGADVVYGSRMLQKENRRGLFMFYWGGRFVTYFTNLLYGTKLTDEPTCYKMFRTSLLKSFKLEYDGFGFCPEVTAKITKMGIPIVEVPISYSPRKQGKKISWRDGLQALWILLRFRFSSPFRVYPRRQTE